MKKRIMALVLSMAMLMSLAACGGKDAAKVDGDLATIKNKGTLVVGITDFEPMDYKDDTSTPRLFANSVARSASKPIQLPFASL